MFYSLRLDGIFTISEELWLNEIIFTVNKHLGLIKLVRAEQILIRILRREKYLQFRNVLLKIGFIHLSLAKRKPAMLLE